MAIPWPLLKIQISHYNLLKIISEDIDDKVSIPPRHYFARNRDTGYEIALKCSFVTSANSEAIANEAQLMEKCSCIWTIPLPEHFNEGSFMYLVMPYFPIPWDLIETDNEMLHSELCWDVVEALVHLHSLGVLHRNVGKSNDFLGRYDFDDGGYGISAFLGDFGLGFKKEKEGTVLSISGTDCHFATELIQGMNCSFCFLTHRR
jgi:serine/threonine protein kinase